MSMPSLLWMGELPAPTVSRQTLRDSGLPTVLPEAVLDILARPCTREEIMLRQAVFARLGGADAPRFAALGDALDALAGAKTAETGAATPLERLYLHAALLRRCAETFPLILALAEEGCLPASHAAFWPAQAERHAALAAALPAIAAKLDVLAACTLLRDDRSGWRIDRAADTRHAAAVRAAACAAALGLPLSPERPLSLRADAALSDAILALAPDTAAALEAIYADLADLPIAALLVCRDELRFYTAVGELLGRAKARGLAVTLPRMADTPTYDADALCDLALLSTEAAIVPNDARMTPSRRFFFLTGANGGGKTTYLRTLVGNLLLARGGCPVAAARACIYPWGQVETHFPADEAFVGSGRFVDEQMRADRMLALARTAGGDCFFCFNETFSGTDHAKGLAHASALARAVADEGCAGLFVTHFHEVAELGLPMLCTVVDGADGNRRTYRIVEEAGIGSSFARDILRKYGLDAASLAARAAEKEGTA